MKWALIIITWYGSHVPASGVEMRFVTETECERAKANVVTMLSEERDPEFGFRVSDCEPVE